MWLITEIGFYSVVQKPGENRLTVRARVGQDLDQLRLRYMPELSETVKGAGTDYQFRATISHAAFAAGMTGLVEDIRYSNFKDRIMQVQGFFREQAYSRVWLLLRNLLN